jgi:hypothetical protein
MNEMLLSHPETRALSLALCDLIAGYREVCRVLDGFEPPEDERAEVLQPLQQAAARAADVLRGLPGVPQQRRAT